MLLPIIWIGVFGGMPWNSPKDPFCPHMYLWNLKKTTYLFSWKNWQHSGWKTGETFLYEFCFFGYLEKLQQHYSISWILGSVHLLTEFLSDTPKQILHVGHSSTLFWGLWMNILLSMYIWTSVCYCFSYYHTSECPSDNGFCRSVPSGDWSNCLIVADGGSRSGSISTTEGPSSIIASPFCGIGKRYRRLDCLDMSNQLAESM